MKDQTTKPTVHIIKSTNERNLTQQEKDNLTYAFETWDEIWIDPQNMNMDHYRKLLKGFKKERVSLVFFSMIPELLILSARQRTIKVWLMNDKGVNQVI